MNTSSNTSPVGDYPKAYSGYTSYIRRCGRRALESGRVGRATAGEDRRDGAGGEAGPSADHRHEQLAGNGHVDRWCTDRRGPRGRRGLARGAARRGWGEGIVGPGEEAGAVERVGDTRCRP